MWWLEKQHTHVYTLVTTLNEIKLQRKKNMYSWGKISPNYIKNNCTFHINKLTVAKVIESLNKAPFGTTKWIEIIFVQINCLILNIFLILARLFTRGWCEKVFFFSPSAMILSKRKKKLLQTIGAQRVSVWEIFKKIQCELSWRKTFYLTISGIVTNIFSMNEDPLATYATMSLTSLPFFFTHPFRFFLLLLHFLSKFVASVRSAE